MAIAAKPNALDDVTTTLDERFPFWIYGGQQDNTSLAVASRTGDAGIEQNDWLETFVNINPVSHVVTAVRDLMNDGQVTAEVGWAVLGCTLVVAIFAPLAVRFYSRKM